MTTKATQPKAEVASKKHILSGVVVSDKMKDTIVVLVQNYVMHPKYQKFQKKGKKFKAHDAGNTAKIGDNVKISECRPLSKDKHFILVK